jgi:hypothetical protein
MHIITLTEAEEKLGGREGQRRTGRARRWPMLGEAGGAGAAA